MLTTINISPSHRWCISKTYFTNVITRRAIRSWRNIKHHKDRCGFLVLTKLIRQLRKIKLCKVNQFNFTSFTSNHGIKRPVVYQVLTSTLNTQTTTICYDSKAGVKCILLNRLLEYIKARFICIHLHPTLAYTYPTIEQVTKHSTK